MQKTKNANGTFLLGVGAQKGGTTWLYNYLKSFDTTDLGQFKEYHIWDATTVPECANFKQKLWNVRNAKQLSRWRMQTSSDYYFAYFQNLLNRDGIHLTADITPTYSALSAASFEKIKSGFERRGIDVKVVFLMRDPVERCWSAMRMRRRRGVGTHRIGTDMEENKALLKYHNSGQSRIRATYIQAITGLQDVFAPDQVFIGLYETLFENRTVETISDFLGVPTDLSFVENHFNVSSKKTDLEETTRKKLANDFRDIYEYCGVRFPETLEKWSGFKYLD